MRHFCHRNSNTSYINRRIKRRSYWRLNQRKQSTMQRIDESTNHSATNQPGAGCRHSNHTDSIKQSISRPHQSTNAYWFVDLLVWPIGWLICRSSILTALLPPTILPVLLFCHFTISNVLPPLRVYLWRHTNAPTGFPICTILTSMRGLPFYHFIILTLLRVISINTSVNASVDGRTNPWVN